MSPEKVTYKLLQNITKQDITNLRAWKNYSHSKVNDPEIFDHAVNLIEQAINSRDLKLFEQGRTLMIHYFFADDSDYIQKNTLYDRFRTEEMAAHLLDK